MSPARCLPLLPLLLLLLLSRFGTAEDPFAMFESESPPLRATTPTGGDCCAEAGRCRRLLEAAGPLRARLAACMPRRRLPSASTPPPRPADRRQLNSAFMQRHVARTLKLLKLEEDVPPAERETFMLTGRISETQVLRLRQFLSDPGGVPLVEVDSLLEDVLANSELESLLTEGRPRWLRRLSALLPAVSPELLPLMLAAALTVWLLVALLFGYSWSYVLSRLLVLLLVVSFFWHWNHLYTRALAERHIQFSPPQGCEEADRGWTDGLLHYVRGLVSFVPPDAVCREYYTKLHVDPFAEVSPGLALAETVTKLVLHPSEQLGRGLGRFYSALAAEVPTLWLVPLIVISLAFILALIVIACRCRPTSGRRAASRDARHVTVKPGRDTVFLVVTEEGDVQPVGEEARRRTSVQRAGPDTPGWLAWAGRGLVRSVSVGALTAGGAVAAGTRALLDRRPRATPPPLVVRTETVPEAAEEHPSTSPHRSEGERHLTVRADGLGTEERSRECDGKRSATMDAGAGGESSGSLEAGDQRTAEEFSGFTQGRADAAAGGDASCAPSSAPRLARSPMTAPSRPVTSSTGPVTSSPSSTASGPAGGGDAAPSEVAPRGGGDGNCELPASPFLNRIREVMDTSMEDKEKE